jgi:hypothetical protein
MLSNLLLMAAVFGQGRLLQPLFPRNFSKVDRFAATALSGLGLLGTLLSRRDDSISLVTVLVVLVPLAALGAVRLAGNRQRSAEPALLPYHSPDLRLIGAHALPLR